MADRIVLVLGTSAGGVGRHVRMLAAGLAARGHRVAVAGPPSTETAFGFQAAGARFVPVPISDRPHPVRDAAAVARLRAVLARADVAHAHGLRAGALTVLARAGAARPGLVVTLHNAPVAGGLIGGVSAVLERIVARGADLVLTVSPDLAERMRARRARRVADAVVPAPPLRAPARTPGQVRRELGAGDRPLLLTVARLSRQKGLETLLAAAAGPYRADPLFLVAGDGPLRGGLQARIDAAGLPVRLLGARDDIADLLPAAHALVVPSRWEGQPLAVQEALRAGRPVIATAVGGIPALVGDAGLLVPPGDAAALREAIDRLLGDEALAAALARRAARRELPDADQALDAVCQVYAGLERTGPPAADPR